MTATSPPSPKSLPHRTPLTAPFWDAGLRGELVLQYDPEAKRYQFYPRPVSLFSKASVEWRRASGLGRVTAVSRHFAHGPGFEHDVPYTMVLVELDEGPRVLAPLKDASDPQAREGLRVRMAWERRSDDFAIYHFVPEAA